MKKSKKWLASMISVIAMAIVLTASIAAANAQTPPAPTGVTATNTTPGVRVSWNTDSASVHRVGWAHAADAADANQAGDWLEAFHFADTKRQTDYTIKYLPAGQQYWVIVGAANNRFGPASWGSWTSLTTSGAAAAARPTATPTPRPTATTVPAPAPTLTPTAEDPGNWTYFSPGCPAEFSNCASFSSDVTFMGLKAFWDTNEEYYDTPSIRVSCWLNRPSFTFDGGGPWIALGETGMSVIIGDSERTWFRTENGSNDLGSAYFGTQSSAAIVNLLLQAEQQGKTIRIGASSDYDTVVADFDPTGTRTNYKRLPCTVN